MKTWDTIIVGGGPSGMAAALACTKDNQRVLLIDRCDKIGKKILVTGNGKCNLTNLLQQPQCYRGEAPACIGSIFSAFGLEETMHFFRQAGILTREKNGYVYPYNEQAACVREAFECCLQERSNLKIMTETSVEEIQPKRDGFIIKVIENNLRYGEIGKDKIGSIEKCFSCHSLIIATGGLAGPGLGCDGSGYRFARKLRHHIINPLPSLTALRSSAPFLKKISGVRNQAEISLWVDEKMVAKEKGELQWTDYGISGVAVFQVSRYAVLALEEKRLVRLFVDFFPEYKDRDLLHLLDSMRYSCPYKNGQEFLNGMLPAKISPILLREAKISTDQKVSKWTKNEVHALAEVLKHFVLRINGYVGYEKAQVTQGGVDMTELTDHLESRLCPGLFFAGEVVDVDGICGGYNLQWAFSSGNVAGQSAYERNNGN